MKNLPPQARQMMEQQMAAAGLNIGLGADPMTIRLCVTPEEASSGPVREGQTDDDCTYTQVKRSGDTWTGRMVCTNPDMTGDFTTTLHDRSRYTTTASMKGGAMGNVVLHSEARRIGADCGALTTRSAG